MTKIKKEDNLLKLQMKNRGISTHLTEILKKYITEHYEQLHSNKLDIVHEMGKFLETYKLPNETQEEIESLNRAITSKRGNQ